MNGNGHWKRLPAAADILVPAGEAITTYSGSDISASYRGSRETTDANNNIGFRPALYVN